jgi:biotin operon repressor
MEVLQMKVLTRTSFISGRNLNAMLEYRRVHVNGEMMTLTGCFFPSTTFLVGPIYLY